MDRSVREAAERAGITEDQARAFLLALREPSYAMLSAGHGIAFKVGAQDVTFGPVATRQLWTAMLDTGLGPN